MATDAYTFSGIILGVVLILSFVVMRLTTQGDTPQLADAVGLFLSCLAIALGARLCWMSVAENALVAVQNERPYIFLAGIAIIWVSVATIHRVFEKRTASQRAKSGTVTNAEEGTKKDAEPLKPATETRRPKPGRS